MKLSIEKAVYGGLGLARLEGKTVFIPFALPGEEVEVHVAEEKRSFINAELDEILQASPARIEPPCPYFFRCGGCHYQQANYQEQLNIKQTVLAESLRRAGVQEFPAIEPVFSEPWAYRNRVRLLVRKDPKFALAYRGWKSHQAVAVDHCPVAAPLLQRAIRECTALGEELNLGAWAREVEFFCDAEEHALSLSITVSRKIKDETLEPLWATLRRKLPELKSLSAFASLEDKEEELRGPLVAQIGEAGLTYRVSDESYHVSAGAFFQVNRYLVPRLAELATNGRSGRLVWDLYAGVGLFAKLLARSFHKVVAVEAAPVSGKDLSKNLTAPHEHVRATTQDFLRGQKKGSPIPDLIVVDPPRAGLGKEIATSLATVGSPEIVYVSCDPSTLGRDLSILLQAGYHLQKLDMVDLFPQTFHLESVAVLVRK